MTEDEKLSTEFFGFGKKKENFISIDEYNTLKTNLSNEYKKIMGISYSTFKQCMKIIYENIFDKESLKRNKYTYEKFIEGQSFIKFRPINAVLSRLDKISNSNWSIKDDKYYEKYAEDNKNFSSIAVFYEGKTYIYGILDDIGYKCLNFTYDESGKPNGRKEPFGFNNAMSKISGSSEYDWFDGDSISHIEDFDIPDMALAIMNKILKAINDSLPESIKKYGSIKYFSYSPGEGYDVCFGFLPNFKIKNNENRTEESLNREYSIESENEKTNFYDNHAHTEKIYNQTIIEFKNTIKKLYSSKLLERNLQRVKNHILDNFKYFPDKINLLNDYLKHLGVKERYTNEQFKSMVKQKLDDYATITPLNDIMKKIDACTKYTTSSIVGKPFGDEDMSDLNSAVLESLSFDADGYRGKELPFHFTFYNFKGSEETLYKNWYLKEICKLDKKISLRQLKRLFTHKDKLMSGGSDDFYNLGKFDDMLINQHVPSSRDSEKEVLHKDLVIFKNMLKKFGELELEYYYIGTAFAFTHVKIDEEWLKVVSSNSNKRKRQDDDDESFEDLNILSLEATKFNQTYDTVIIFRYDGPSKWDDNCMAIQLVYENNNWTINNTSVSKVFNEKEIEEMFVHCNNKQKSNAKVLILANENIKLREVLINLGYEFKSLYEILPDKLKKYYPLLTVGEPGSPYPNSQKNMNIDVSFFYKAFNGNKIKSFEEFVLSKEAFFNTSDLLKGFTSTHETDTEAKKKVKIFKCPICKKKYTSAKFLENHVLQEHTDMIPRDMPVAQYIFNLKNKKEHGNCVICKRPTSWNEKINKYHRFCSQKCKDIYIKEARARLMRVYGTDNLAKDPEHQKKMLENRKISKKYTFSDGGTINCVGSYEYDFIKYCDEVMGFGSKDIVDPSHNNILFRYEFENKERFYIPDYYMPDYNLLIEIKDKGDNNHENIKIHMKAMDSEKFRAVIESNKYNFITVCGKDYSRFVELIEYLKSESLDEKSDNKYIISIDQNVYKEYKLRSDDF